MSQPESGGLGATLSLSRPGFDLNIDLSLPGRGVTVLFGPSGSGKTSCLRALAGLDRARGRVHVNGETWQDDASGIWIPTYQRALAYVFQDGRLFDHLTVRGNLEFGIQHLARAERRAALQQSVDLLGLGALLDRYPDHLSGGERQRVGMARALATRPRLMLMDEPLASLDERLKNDILPWIERLHRHMDIPVVYVTHAIDEVARLADTLVLMGEGRALACGPASALLTQLDLSPAQGDGAGAVVNATVHSHDPDCHLTLADFPGGRLALPRQPLQPGDPLRVHIKARDVSLALSRHADSSILNILDATVTALSESHPGQVTVALTAGTTPLLARISRKSVEALAIAPGRQVFAQIKSVAILG